MNGLSFSETGHGPPIVLVHAGVADGRMWAPQVERFAADYWVIVPDLRGFGDTPVPTQSFAHAADLRELADDLGIAGAAWIGCSMGGTALLDLALAAPDLVAALVVIDCVPSGYRVTDPITREGWAAAEAAYERGDFTGAATVETEMWLVGPAREAADVPRELRDLVATMLLASYAHGEGDEADPPRPAVDHLEEISAPTLVVVGTHDQPDFKVAAEVMADRIPGARLAVVDGAAHLPSLEQPDVFNELLGSFLTTVYG